MPYTTGDTTRHTMPSELGQLNVRLDAESKDILERLQAYYGLTQAGVVKLLLRDKKREIEREEGKDALKRRLGH